MKLAALGLSHEANSFSEVAADLAQFQSAGILRGSEIRDAYGAAEASMSGFLEAESLVDVEVVPLLFTTITPMGEITDEAFESIVGEMVFLLSSGSPWDGILLALHGAAVSASLEDADGEIIRRVRQAVGPHIPIGVAVDLHANLTRLMVDNCNLLTAYLTNPHIDARSRASEVASLVVRAVRHEVRPVQALEMIPLMPSIDKMGTDSEPMRSVLEDALHVRSVPGVLSVSVTQGHCYVDVSRFGMAALVVTDGDADLARSSARWLASRVWSRRDRFLGSFATVEEALDRAATIKKGPVLLLDVGDNIGGGAAGDSVAILSSARRMGLTRVLTIVVDAEAASECCAAGVGATVRLEVGSYADGIRNRKLELLGRVIAVHSGEYDAGEQVSHGGFRYFKAGLTAAIELVDGTVVVCISRPTMPSSAQQLLVLGLEPSTFEFIIAKGVHSPLTAYRRYASEVIAVDTPGPTTGNFGKLTYTRRSRPLYPFELNATYEVEAPNPEGVSEGRR